MAQREQSGRSGTLRALDGVENQSEYLRNVTDQRRARIARGTRGPLRGAQWTAREVEVATEVLGDYLQFDPDPGYLPGQVSDGDVLADAALPDEISAKRWEALREQVRLSTLLGGAQIPEAVVPKITITMLHQES